MLAQAPAEPVYDPSRDLVARRTATAPDVDGVVDAVWDDALKLGTFVTGNSGAFDVWLRAMFDDDYIYILAEWTEFNPPDPPEPNVERDLWELTSNSTPGTWDHKDWGEDRISFFFQDPDNEVENFTSQGCDAICHDLSTMHTKNPGEMLDAWIWSAATTNEQGYADDGVLQNNNTLTIDPKRHHVTDSDMAWDSGADGWWNNTDFPNATERPAYVLRPGATPADPRFLDISDAMAVDWATFNITTIPQGTLIPGHVLMAPSGDRADIQSKGVHDGQNWTVEFKRLRDTGSTDDVAFDQVNTRYRFSPSVTNNRTGADHSKGITAYTLWLAEPEKPDLVAANLSPVGTTHSVNATVQVGVFVENIGWTDASASQLSWYWDEPGAPGPLLVSTPSIEWGKTQYVLVNASSQDLTPGNNTIVVEVDAQGDIDEIHEDNNVANLTIFLEEEALPNLRVDTFEMDPPILTDGAFAEVSASVVNSGNLASPPAKIVLELVGAEIPPVTTDTLPVIDFGDSHLWQFTWGPVTLSAGDYELNVTVDPDGEIKESDETDNWMLLPFTMSAVVLPDLVVQSVTPLNTTVAQGDETRAQIVIDNIGGATVTDNFQVALFLNEAFTVGTVGLVGTVDVTDDIPAGENTSVVIIWTVPVDTPVGSENFIRAEADLLRAVDELDDGNNNGTFDGLVVTRRALPDLTVPAVVPIGSTVKLDERITFTITVSNQGTLATSTTTTLQIKDLLHNNTLDSLTVPELDIGQSEDLTFEWFVDDVAPGMVTLQFLVDPLNLIDEEDEFNNGLNNQILVEPADLPDLTIPENGITFFPAEPQVGDAVTISISVKNVGTNSSGETTMVEVRLGNNRIATADLLPLGAGESRTLEVVWPAQEIQTPLTYNLTFRVDPDDLIKERDDTNNVLEFVGITFVRAPEAALENLVMASSGTEVKDGGTVKLTVSLDNTGDEPAVITIVVIDGLVEVATKQGVTIPAGGNKTESFDIKLKGTGDHTLTVTIYHGTEVAQDPAGNDLIIDLTVKVTEKDSDGDGIGLMVIVIVVVILAIVGVAAMFIMRRK
jgi:subtilase family serine protease